MSNEVEQFICSVCQETFARKTHLDRHIRAHLNRRTYNCTHCGKATFTRSDLLTRHLKRCSQSPVGVPIPRKKACRICIIRKVKCDLQKPCVRCSTRGDECVYEAQQPAPPEAAHLSLQKPTSSNPVLFEELLPESTPQGREDEDEVSQEHSQPNIQSLPMSTRLPAFSTSIADSLCYEESLAKTDLDKPDNSPLDNFPNYDNLLLSSLGTDATVVATAQHYAMPASNTTLLAARGCQYFPEPPSQEFTAHEEEIYMSLFMRMYCTNIPILHLQTWAPDSASPLLRSSILACGALFSPEYKARAYTKRILQSDLRQQIFRQFLTLQLDDIDKQLDLLLAMVILQGVGLWYKDDEEQRISAGYHGMTIHMLRRSGLLKVLFEWVQSQLNHLDTHMAWRSWAQFETIKRTVMLIYSFESTMPIFFNLAPVLLDTEINVLLPCDDFIWEAVNEEEWTQCILSNTDLRGSPVDMVIFALFNNSSLPSLNDFGSLIVLHGLFRWLFHASNNLEKHPITFKIALQRWYNQHFTRSLITEHPNLTDAFPLYWLAQNMQNDDHCQFLDQEGEERWQLFGEWVRNIWPMLGEGGRFPNIYS